MLCRLLHREELSVGMKGLLLLSKIVSAADDLTLVDHNSADGNFPFCRSDFSELKRDFHHLNVYGRRHLTPSKNIAPSRKPLLNNRTASGVKRCRPTVLAEFFSDRESTYYPPMIGSRLLCHFARESR